MGHFTQDQIFPLYPSLLFIFLSVIVFVFRKHTRDAIILLLIGAFGLRVFISLLDPFVNIWDEQYHALVAKNMIDDPFTPMLYRYHVLPVDTSNWALAHIWLHKQPLFQWQMALSMKLFGINEFAMRLPSIVLSTVVVFFIYRIGKRTVNERVGYYAAVLFAMSWFGIELAGGKINTDHNDADFTAYVTGSIWAWVEFVHSGQKRWAILVGIFVGFALLVKWLPGILVFSGWGIWVLLDKEKRKSWKAYKEILYTGLIALVIALPWQIYIFLRWPELSRIVYEHNVRHFTEPLDGHAGTIFYHWDQLRFQYGAGELVPWIILFSLFLLYKRLNQKAYRIAFFTFVVVVYTFYTITVTKMPAFCYIVCSIIFISLGNVLDVIFQFISSKLRRQWAYSSILILVLGYISFTTLDLHRIEEHHTLISIEKSSYRVFRLNNLKTFKSLDELLPSKDYVIFNCRPGEEIMGMFYSDYIIYGKVLNEENYRMLKSKGIKIAVFDGEHTIEAIKDDPEVIKIQSTMWAPDFLGLPQR